ncbi:MAG: hypothetical protein H7837_13820 [Magnetococcus sp. MYC-9]
MSSEKITTEKLELCGEVHVEIGENGYSVCRSDHAMVGDCILDGVHDLRDAIALAASLSEEGQQTVECPASDGSQQIPCLNKIKILSEQLQNTQP